MVESVKLKMSKEENKKRGRNVSHNARGSNDVVCGSEDVDRRVQERESLILKLFKSIREKLF